MLRIKVWPILLVLLAARTAFAAPIDQQQLAAADNDFSFNLLQQLTTGQPGSNIFISAYSASTALQMISVGAEGNTLAEMKEAVGDAAMSASAIDMGNKSVISIINAHNTNFLLSTANAVWYRRGIPLRHSFVGINRAFFHATVEGLDFSQPSAADTINHWAAQQTHGKITKIVQGKIPGNVELFLNNAVYFLGTWESKFDSNYTQIAPFYLSDGGDEAVPMMTQTGPFAFAQTDTYQAVRLPYAGNKLAMYVFLPSSSSSVSDVLNSINGQSWHQLEAGFEMGQGTVLLPRFKLNFSGSLVPALTSLGMVTAFTPEADFSKLSPVPLFISDVQQQAVVDVNEKGTEAAAVTTITVITSVVDPMFTFDANRPFLFFIVDEPAGLILFSGAVYQP